jgi:hypothetical protein
MRNVTKFIYFFGCLFFISTSFAELQLIFLKVIQGSTVCLCYLLVVPWHFALARSDDFPHLHKVTSIFVDDAFKIRHKATHLLLTLLHTFLIKSSPVGSTHFSENFRPEKQLHVGSVERLLADSEPGSGLFVRVIEIDEGYVHEFCRGSEVVVVEATHLSALVLVPFAKKLFLCKLKSPPVEQFLILVRPFLGHKALPLNFLEDLSFLL